MPGSGPLPFSSQLFSCQFPFFVPATNQLIDCCCFSLCRLALLVLTVLAGLTPALGVETVQRGDAAKDVEAAYRDLRFHGALAYQEARASCMEASSAIQASAAALVEHLQSQISRLETSLDPPPCPAIPPEEKAAVAAGFPR